MVKIDSELTLRVEVAHWLGALRPVVRVHLRGLRSDQGLTPRAVVLQIDLSFAARVSDSTWLPLLVRASRSGTTAWRALKVRSSSTVAIAQSILSHCSRLPLLLRQFSLPGEDAGRASRGLRDHGYHHAWALWRVPTAVRLPAARAFRLVLTPVVAPTWHRWLPFRLRGDSALVPALRLSAPVVPEEVLLHLDIDHLANIFLVELLDVSTESIIEMGYLLVCVLVCVLLCR